MLIYHPAFDAYHCTFRILVILEQLGTVEVDKARILDFYLAFPSALEAIRWPRQFGNGRKIAKTLRNPYRDPLGGPVTFRNMQHLQQAALRCIAGSDFISTEQLALGVAQRSDKPLSRTVKANLEAFIERQPQLTDLVLTRLSTLPLLGHDGLRARTALMEHRYDPN